MRLARIACAATMLTLAAGANAEDVAFSNPPGVAAPAGYSHVAVVPAGHRTIYVAGQLGFLPDGTMAGEPGDFSAQAEQAFRNVSEALRSAGSSWDQVVKINMYVTDARSQLPLLRQVRDRFVNTDSPPTSTTVQIASLVVPGALFEIDAVAVQP